MGAIADKWRQNWGAHMSQYGTYYKRAAECGGTGLEKMECAANVMKEIKTARRAKLGL